MAASSKASTYDSLRRQIISHNFAPVYFLHGEEGYFIDELVKLLEVALPEDDREFNQYILYGGDSTASDAVTRCQAYPMMSDRVMVIVKEAQIWDQRQLPALIPYLNNPMPTTTLVIVCRGKVVKNKELFNAITAIRGEVFESKKLKEGGVMQEVERLLSERGLNIEPKGLSMMCDFVGTDMSRLYNQVEKLSVVLEKGAMVTPEVIERNIGVSREFNTFELKDAIFARDATKSVRIIEQFRANPKTNPAIPVVATLFSGFSDLLIYHFTRDKSPQSLMGALGFKWPVQLQSVEKAAHNFNARQTIAIITLLRDTDRKMKGIGSRMDPYDLLRNLIFNIFNCRGI